MKELDVLLERYARAHLASASPEARGVLARLLELPDPLISDYLFGQADTPDPALAALARLITTSPVCGIRALPAGTAQNGLVAAHEL
jgi:succinate dehydrogenase flavin-adding protein (antitoxin of CptAB toxin-antitoxin module)